MAANLNDGNGALSRDELKQWTVAQLSSFLRDRGVVISADGGRKEQLVEKVYYAKQLGLEVVRTEQQVMEDIAARRKSKLTFDGVSLPFPENIHSWLKGSEYLPDTTLSDLENYFKANNGVKALAEGKSLFESGHVSSVEYNGISNGVSFCYVRGKVVPQTRINDPPYTVWVCLRSVSGAVMTGECKCLAGFGECCKHVAALLHYIEQEVRTGNNKTCTSKTQTWGKKAPNSKKKKIHEPAKISDIRIKKARLDVDDSEDLKFPRSKFDPRPFPDRKSCFAQKDWENLAKASNGNCSLLGFIPTDFVQQMSAKLDEKINKLPPTVPELVERISQQMPCASLKEKCRKLKHDMTLCIEECTAIKEATLQQYKTNLWREFRIGRITASKAHDVISKYDDSLNIKNVKAAQNLCAEICGYKKQVDAKPMQWGRQNEPRARNKYRKDSKAHHTSFTCNESGLVISAKYPYLAASPDGEVSCKCHGVGLYECKCPWTHRDKTTNEFVAQSESFLVLDGSYFFNIVDDIINRAFQVVGLGDISTAIEEACSTKPFKLKCSHKHHTQVQHAMFVCQKEYCDFHVYLPKECFVQRITPCDNYFKDNFPKLEKFFDDFIAPEMFTKKIQAKEIVTVILNGIVDSVQV